MTPPSAASSGRRNTGTARVIGQTQHRHRPQEFRNYLDTIEKNVPALFDVLKLRHHKTLLICNWLGQTTTLPPAFTPTLASWLNLVERWFASLIDKQL